MRTFRVERMVLGMIRTNCYLLIREDTGETLIVDPADRADRIEAKLTEEHLTLCGVLLTHGHFDHIGAAEELRKRYGIRIYLPEKEEALAGDSFRKSFRAVGFSFWYQSRRAVKRRGNTGAGRLFH